MFGVAPNTYRPPVSFVQGIYPNRHFFTPETFMSHSRPSAVALTSGHRVYLLGGLKRRRFEQCLDNVADEVLLLEFVGFFLLFNFDSGGLPC
jgi:hypothetical protein